ncbi:unnamed protein product [Blepharisma stoltei]|uniref:Uncharacterized protein n=1 Tax=Blepharisma stoltei TaxID=1481888 RepID=A0AAU9J043_9CILI|nr:unnamed protein product [Blepharisma stoltei]
MEHRKIESDIEGLVKKYNLDSDPFAGYSFKASPNREYELQKQEESFKLSRSSPLMPSHLIYESPQYSKTPELYEQQKESMNSKAIASAMKALQDRLKSVENAKNQLQADMDTLEKKNYEDKQKLSSELKRAVYNEKDLEKKCYECDQVLKAKNALIIKLEDQVGFLNTQCEFIEKENKRVQAQYKIDKENWALQAEHFKKLLNSKNNSEESSLEALSAEKAKNRNLEGKILEKDIMIDSLNEEIYELQQNLDSQKEINKKNTDRLEEELRKTKLELNDKERRLEEANRNYQEMITKKETEIRELRLHISELNKMNNLNEEARNALKREHIETRHYVKDITEINEQLVDSLKRENQVKFLLNNSMRERSLSSKSSKKRKKFAMSLKKPSFKKIPKTSKHKREVSEGSSSERSSKGFTPRRHVKSPSYLDSNKNKERELEFRIQELDREISQLNGMYKQLLLMSDDENRDLGSLKAQLDDISGKMEEKSKILYSLKRKHQGMLREKMLTFN